MVGPRWRKVLSDLWSNKTRTLLVALSIAVGVFAVGMIAESRVRLLRGLSEQYMAGKPFSFVISTVEPFDDDLVDVIQKMDGVAAAEGLLQAVQGRHLLHTRRAPSMGEYATRRHPRL